MTRGYNVDPDSPPPLAGLAIDATLKTDQPCVRCGYNLRGLQREATCPECGTPVERSLLGNYLRFADPDWVKKLSLGTSLMLWNIVIVVVLNLLGQFFSAFSVLPYEIEVGIGLVASGLATAAVFLVTTQEPAISITEDTVTLRKAVRASALIAFAGAVFEVGPTYLEETTLVLISVQLIGGLANLFMTIGQFVYFRRFALRIPDEDLARSTTIVMWGLVFAGICALLISSTTVLFRSASALFSGGLFVGGACIVGVAALVFGIWYLVLLIRYSRAFSKAAREALENAMVQPRSPGVHS